MKIGLPVEIVPLQINWGSFETLSSVYDLASCLLHQWPADTSGEAYVTALIICAAALQGGEEDAPEHAREAFIEAAREVGLAVEEDDFGPDF